MGSKNMKFALLVATALIGMNQAKAEIAASDFTALENMRPEQRDFVRKQFEISGIGADVDWDNLVAGMRADGSVELRDKATLQLCFVSQPSCFGRR